MSTLRLLLAVLYFLDLYIATFCKQIKLIYEKDMSEYCRRRVLPSIFLGRQVVEANARVLQFSRLELPYSCFISIRTESGSNMVMMIQVMSDELLEVCKANEQLLVYEMGETFGGYWGPLPESVLKSDTLPPKVYTLKTRPPSLEIMKSITETEDTRTTSTASTTTPEEDQRTGDYLEVEVPFLNVSVHYMPLKENQTMTSLDLEESFDMHYDVTPVPGIEYDRSMFPLVQFRVVDQSGRRGEGEADGEPPKYELDIVQDFTPDLRLTWPQLNFSKKRGHKHKERYQATRRLNFKKHRTLFQSQRFQDRRKTYEAITKNVQDVTKYSFPSTAILTQGKSKHTQDSWKVIEDLLKKLNKTDKKLLKTKISLKNATLMEMITNLNLDKSVYLAPNLSIYYDSKDEGNKLFSTINTESITRNTVNFKVYDEANSLISTKNTGPRNPNGLITWNPVNQNLNSVDLTTTTEMKLKSSVFLPDDVTVDQIVFEDEKTTTSATATKSLDATEAGIDEQAPTDLVSATNMSRDSENTIRTVENDDVDENTTEIQSSIPIETTISGAISVFDSNNDKSKIPTGFMVGHESWENVVQAAPEMAILLNQSVAEIISRGNTSDDVAKETSEGPYKNKKKHKKRDIHSIAIEDAQPHYLVTKETAITTTKLAFNVADMQEFAQLVELQDDELHGRVALRYLRQHVGPPLFNLCSITKSMMPYVYLFNSSRIVISLTNFTLERMVIILTAARALRSGEVWCPSSRLECQVSGARVCLDSTVACDGVPNCGSYDIYDEDRLLCGYSVLTSNVYLAAITFLAVLLTLVYAIHYWLKRYIPKVADAFFVYSDGVENVLYLDSVMHSPCEMELGPRLAYQSHLYEDDIDYEGNAEPPRNAFQRFLRKICCCCLCFRSINKKNEEKETASVNLNISNTMSRKIYSFTELEILKMFSSSKDTGVQTSDSLQMNSSENAKEKKPLRASYNPELPKRSATTSFDFSVKIVDSLLTLEEPLPEEYKDELSLLKFFKEARSDSVASSSKNIIPDKKPHQSLEVKIEPQSEREIEIHTYDRHGISQPGPSKIRNQENEKAPSLRSVNKHLRFNEITTTIPSKRYIDEDEEELRTPDNVRRTVALDNKKRRGSRLDPIEEGDEHGGGVKEHRNFWGRGTGQKSKKKKTQISLR